MTKMPAGAPGKGEYPKLIQQIDFLKFELERLKAENQAYRDRIAELQGQAPETILDAEIIEEPPC